MKDNPDYSCCPGSTLTRVTLPISVPSPAPTPVGASHAEAQHALDKKLVIDYWYLNISDTSSNKGQVHMLPDNQNI